MTLKEKMINQNKLEQYELVKKFYKEYFLNIDPIDAFIEIYSYENDLNKSHNIKFDIIEMLLELLQNFEFDGKIIKNLVDDPSISISTSLYILEGVICARIDTIYIYTFIILYISEHYFKKQNLEFSEKEKLIISDFFLETVKAEELEIAICYEIAKNTILNKTDIKTEVEKWTSNNKKLLHNGYYNLDKSNLFYDEFLADGEIDYCLDYIFQEDDINHNDEMEDTIKLICEQNNWVSETKQNEEFWDYLRYNDWTELETLSTFDFLEFLKK